MRKLRDEKVCEQRALCRQANDKFINFAGVTQNVMVAFKELQNRIRESIDIKILASEIAGILNKFEKEEKPVIYDEEFDASSLRFAKPNHPKYEKFLSNLGFLDRVYKNENPYDYHKLVLNAKAREMYEQLKKEGYYAEATTREPSKKY